jgi:hypothetical protein
MCLPARLVVNEATGTPRLHEPPVPREASIAADICRAQGIRPGSGQALRSFVEAYATPQPVLVSARMARRSLRPELNRIRAWVRQGRTDAWIAHQLEVTVQQIQAFKREQGLEPDGDPEAPGVGLDFDDEIDLRAEDDALIAAELEAAEAQRAEQDDEDDGDEEGEEGEQPRRRRRGRRGGRRGTRRKATTLEATFDHGEEGYGLWLDPAVQDDPIYAEYWAGHRPVEVAIEEDQIVIRRVGDEDAGDDQD